ncbi:hypothetical protein DRP77_05870 [Candidatus Poribacteria bacterium]|nr:MAG: hypothetical protein DRP77_05870 [Candidatus Poribacteria bacterium]
MRFRIVALDVDGTLTNSKGEITERTRRAVQRAAERGALVVVVTGRRFCSAKPIVEALGVDLMIAAHNGALLKKLDGEFITGVFLEPEYARLAVGMLKRIGAEPIVYRGTGDYAEIFVEPPRNEWLADYIERNREHARIVPSLEETISWEALEVLAVVRADESEEIVRSLREGLEGKAKVLKQIPQGDDRAFIEVAHRECAKDYPLRYLCGKLKIRREEVVAFGDNYNDREMLEFAGLGVVMGNAHDELKEEGRFLIAPSNDEDGVAQVLERLMEEGRI